MKLRFALFLLLLSTCALFQCRKDKNVSAITSDAKFLQEAKQYFETTVLPAAEPSLDPNPRRKSAKTIDWGRATLTRLPEGEIITAPILFQKSLYFSTPLAPGIPIRLDSLTRLLIFKDTQSQLHAQEITAIPDSSYLNGSGGTFSGILMVEDWNGNPISKYKFRPDGTILKLNSAIAFAAADTAVSRRNIDKTTPTTLTAVCYEIDGYNYSPDDPNGGVYWSESAGCDYQYQPPGFPPPASVSPGGYNTALAALGVHIIASRLLVAGASNPIANVQQYFKCFTNSGAIDHSYSVTICVDEPNPGTRQPWGFTSGGPAGSSAAGNIINCGHTFAVLTEDDGGTIITRNVGFYPTGVVSPLTPSNQGVLNDDESHGYSVSITFQVTNLQFFNILNYMSVGNNSGYMYDLNSNNCTTFCIHAMAAGGISTPSTIGNWPMGRGNDPGDYGADFRTMPLSPNMSRNTTTSYHPNVGICLNRRVPAFNLLSLTINTSSHETPFPGDPAPLLARTLFVNSTRVKSTNGLPEHPLGKSKQLENI